jgi:hypothetical protein
MRRFVVGALVCCAAGGLLAGMASAASTPAAVMVAGQESTGGNGSSQGSLTTLYVDASGGAHVAWAAYAPAGGSQTGMIDECTIPWGGKRCGGETSIPTVVVADKGGMINTLKYLPGPHGAEYLAAGITGLSTPDGTETEVFGPGLGSGIDAGNVDDGSDGDMILRPDATGIDVVGQDFAYSGAINADCTPPAFQADSFTPGAGGSPMFLGGNARCLGYGNYYTVPDMVGVTLLPLGQTAVLAYRVPNSDNALAYPVGMYVQPASGGAFGPFEPLGVSGSFETDFSPSGASYLLNVEVAQEKPSDEGATMELYRFRGTVLKPVATVGLVGVDWINPNAANATWNGLPPTFEDADGNFYAEWLVDGGVEGCPSEPGYTGPYDSIFCIAARQISDGGVPGPIVLLGSNRAAKPGTSFGPPVDLGPISANAQGQAWGLHDVTLPGSAPGAPGVANVVLYAQPFPTTADATAPAGTHGSDVTVPVHCSGAASTTCTVNGLLEGGGAPLRSGDQGSTAAAHIYARTTERIRGGRTETIKLALDKAARKTLHKRHRLTATLVVTETVGLLSKPTTVLSQVVKFGR